MHFNNQFLLRFHGFFPNMLSKMTFLTPPMKILYLANEETDVGR
jgi:hypothetical protein